MYRTAPGHAPPAPPPVSLLVYAAAVACIGTLVLVAVLQLAGWHPWYSFTRIHNDPAFLRNANVWTFFPPAWLLLLHAAVRGARTTTTGRRVTLATGLAWGALATYLVWRVLPTVAAPRTQFVMLQECPALLVGALVTLHAVIVLRRTHPWERWMPLALVGVHLVGGALVVIQNVAGPWFGGAQYDLLCLASLTCLIDVSEFRSRAGHAFLPVACALLCLPLMGDADLWGPTRAMALAAVAWPFARAMPRNRANPSARWLAWLAVVLAVEAGVLRPWMRGSGMLSLGTMVAALLVRRADAADAPRPGARAAAITLMAGSQAWLALYLALGTDDALPPSARLPASLASLIPAGVGAIAWWTAFRPARPTPPR